jgi:nitrogenase iron protein NifH
MYLHKTKIALWKGLIMIKIAVYGKGGIGKSTTVSNLSAVLAKQGLTVMQVGCDPKADSTLHLQEGRMVRTVLDLFREKGKAVSLEEMVTPGYLGVLCVEAGGPTPGLGCAGRGIAAVFELLEEKKAFEVYHPDIVIYDVLGDVVCGGFALPIREGYAKKVFIVTSGENMSIHAAANIAVAVDNFKDRGYAGLGGIILNRRNVDHEEEKVSELANDIHTQIIGYLPLHPLVQQAEQLNQTVIEAFPDSDMAKQYEILAEQVLAACN